MKEMHFANCLVKEDADTAEKAERFIRRLRSPTKIAYATAISMYFRGLLENWPQRESFDLTDVEASSIRNSLAEFGISPAKKAQKRV